MSRPVKVLLVEDSPDEAELVKVALEQHGFDVSLHRVWDADTMSAALADGSWDVVISNAAQRNSFFRPSSITACRKEVISQLKPKPAELIKRSRL